MLEAIYNKWKSKIVTGEETAPKPGLLNFFNAAPALDLLHRHLVSASKIAVHCDVDMDGLGSGYIVKRFISSLTPTNQIYFINKEKEHGIQLKHCEFFSKNPIDLLIILDSSSNEIETVRKFNCDVIIVDHHEVTQSNTWGYTDDGHLFILVNNTLDNSDTSVLSNWMKLNNPNSVEKIEPYNADNRMSCGLVIYELLRLYQEAYLTGPILENMMLYQWVGVTLITDAIPLLSDRNQWYMEKTVHSTYTEQTLMAITKSLNEYATGLSKSLIGYTIAPTFNRAIRAGATSDVLNIIMDYPNYANTLQKYRELQDWAVSEGIKDIDEYDSFILKDLTGTGIKASYTGVIAGKLCDEHNKNCVVFNVTDGIAKGSFRGRVQGSDYRKQFDEFNDTSKAQGHKVAFGFEARIEDLPQIMKSLESIEEEIDSRHYLTAGNLPDNLKGKYHIDDISEFKRYGGIMMLGIGNSKVSSDEQIMISVLSTEASLTEIRGKLYMYNILGLNCKAFKEIEPGMINIYIEQSKTLEFFVK